MGKMKKKIFLLTLLALSLLFGCSSKSSEEEEHVVKKIQKQEAGYYQFNKNILIGYGFEMILKPDGTIIARGRNNNGELGNGTLQDSTEWNSVSNVSDVKQIAYTGNMDKGTVYALKNDGTVWWWGSEQVTPVKVRGLDNVDALLTKNWGSDSVGHCGIEGFAHNNDKTFFELYGGEIVKNNFASDGKIKVDDVSMDSIGNNSYLYILDGKLYCFTDDGETIPLNEVQNAKEIFYSMGDHARVLNEYGEVYSINFYPGDIQVEFNGGSGIKKAFEILPFNDDYRFYVELFKDGKVFTMGRNEFGELGNGTMEPYESQWWEVELPYIENVFSNLNGDVFAIDSDNNLFAWGNKYDTLPEIQYNIDEIIAESISQD